MRKSFSAMSSRLDSRWTARWLCYTMPCDSDGRRYCNKAKSRQAVTISLDGCCVGSADVLLAGEGRPREQESRKEHFPSVRAAPALHMRA